MTEERKYRRQSLPIYRYNMTQHLHYSDKKKKRERHSLAAIPNNNINDSEEKSEGKVLLQDLQQVRTDIETIQSSLDQLNQLLLENDEDFSTLFSEDNESDGEASSFLEENALSGLILRVPQLVESQEEEEEKEESSCISSLGIDGYEISHLRREASKSLGSGTVLRFEHNNDEDEDSNSMSVDTSCLSTWDGLDLLQFIFLEFLITIKETVTSLLISSMKTQKRLWVVVLLFIGLFNFSPSLQQHQNNASQSCVMSSPTTTTINSFNESFHLLPELNNEVLMVNDTQDLGLLSSSVESGSNSNLSVAFNHQHQSPQVIDLIQSSTLDILRRAWSSKSSAPQRPTKQHKNNLVPLLKNTHKMWNGYRDPFGAATHQKKNEKMSLFQQYQRPIQKSRINEETIWKNYKDPYLSTKQKKKKVPSLWKRAANMWKNTPINVNSSPNVRLLRLVQNEEE
jgi:hypothetical protein